MLTGEAKWGALNGAEAFVLPSHQENFGIAVVEAMACGVPVLLSRQINICREIAEDRAGFVAEDTREGTESLLLSWARLSDQDKSVMKKAAKTSYEKRFGISRTADNLLSTIEDLLTR
jgi:glycosyltransferase involved in cell wall biosynthesis